MFPVGRRLRELSMPTLALFMNRSDLRKVLYCGGPPPLCDDTGASKSGRGLPQSRTLTRHPRAFSVKHTFSPLPTENVEEPKQY